ncbi:hypothetical protein APX70_03404, partial [Pseudomonas syringae pv. maculicola]
MQNPVGPLRILVFDGQVDDAGVSACLSNLQAILINQRGAERA